MKSKFLFYSGLLLISGQAIGQNGPGTSGDVAPVFELQLLHASDLEGGVNAITRAPFFAAIVDHLEDTYANTITLSAGDNYIPGPFFNAASDPAVRPALKSVTQDYFGIAGPTDIREAAGRIDITIANVIGFDASALGNHEFDAGTSAIQEIIAPLLPGLSVASSRWYGAQFPYLSSNLDFSQDPLLAPLYTSDILPNTAFQSLPSDLPAALAAKKIAPATLIERNGELIGVVGATTQVLATISSPGLVTETTGGSNNMAALAAVLQPVINDLMMAGANKIILVSHLQQIALELALAELLVGVDIIVAGGSDAILANGNNRLASGDVAVFEYPIVTSDAMGDPMLVVSTNGEYSYVGRLVVQFNADGVIDLSSLNADINGPYVSDLEMVNDLWNDSPEAFATNSKYELVSRLTNAVSDVVTVKDGNILGKSAVYLDGQRNQVRTQETNLGNISADANLFVAKTFDETTTVSIKNGGGIRAAIGQVAEVNPGEFVYLPPQANPLSGKQETEVSQLDVENSLRFNNLLSIVTLSAQGLVAIVEHGFSAVAPGATPGQFPQIGGMKVSFDPALPAGARIRNLVIVDENALPIDSIVVDGVVKGDPQRSVRVVTLNFLASGGDGYPFPALSTNRVDLNTVGLDAGNFTFAIPGSEQDAMAEYLFTNFSETPYSEAETPASEDQRIQNLSEKADEVYVFCADGFFPAPQNVRVVQSSEFAFVYLRWKPVPGAMACRVKGGSVGGVIRSKDVYAVDGEAPYFLKVPKTELELGSIHQFTVQCACSLDPIVAGGISQTVYFVPLASQQSIILSADEVDAAIQMSFSSEEMSIYPNPSNLGYVQVSVGSSISDSNATLEMFDMTGKRIAAQNLSVENQRMITIETGHLPKGIYLITLTNDNQRLSQKIVVN